PGKRVLWQVVDGPEEWLGTKISFDIKQNGEWTVILFKHQGWKEPVEFMHHCSTKWAVFLLSLKSLLETGKGAPWPNEIKLDSWEDKPHRPEEGRGPTPGLERVKQAAG